MDLWNGRHLNFFYEKCVMNFRMVGFDGWVVNNPFLSLWWLARYIAPSYEIVGSWERLEFKILYENCVMNLRMVSWTHVSIRMDMWWLGS